MLPGDLTVACNPTVVVGHDVAFRAERHTEPPAERWALCVSTNRARIRLGQVAPEAMAYLLDPVGVLHLLFPAAVRSVELTIDSGDVGESEWKFWVDDVAWGDRQAPSLADA
jgi:hypothetical protein